jgi:hypothetical protein
MPAASYPHAILRSREPGRGWSGVGSLVARSLAPAWTIRPLAGATSAMVGVQPASLPAAGILP